MTKLIADGEAWDGLIAMRRCPCNCGQKLGALSVLKQAAAVGVKESTAFLAMLEDGIDPAALSEADRRECEEWFQVLRAMRVDFLEHVHGTASPGRTPELYQLQENLAAMKAGFAA